MTTKTPASKKMTTTVNSLRGTIREMVQSELKSLVKERREGVLNTLNEQEEVNAIFSSLRPADRKAMTDWIMRYYFSPKKQGESWFSPKVNAKNVLQYISNPKSGFPLTPREVADDWRIKKSLKGDLKKIEDKDIEAFQKNEPEEGEKYNTGEKSLKDIGGELGGLTAAMINKLEQSGMAKFIKTMGGQNPMTMDEEELDAVLANVDKARLETSMEFANDLKAAKGNVKNFLATLAKKQILAPTDLKLMQPRELEMLVFLMSKPPEQVAEYLRGDARKSDNKIKSFQAAVARKLFPAGKRGRPRKNPVA
ncbi:MAG: hypothetical protein WC761_01865 [Candidatus Paceibacterota bacterium]|jgi:hypothetical protein